MDSIDRPGNSCVEGVCIRGRTEPLGASNVSLAVAQILLMASLAHDQLTKEPPSTAALDYGKWSAPEIMARVRRRMDRTADTRGRLNQDGDG